MGEVPGAPRFLIEALDERPMYDLDMPVRALTALARNGARTIADVRWWLTRDDLMQEAPIWTIRGIGWKTIEACMAALQDFDRAHEPAKVWLVTWGFYAHGIFASQEDAEAYSERRWGPDWRTIDGWRIQAWPLGYGSFDPANGEDDDSDGLRPHA